MTLQVGIVPPEGGRDESPCHPAHAVKDDIDEALHIDGMRKCLTYALILKWFLFEVESKEARGCDRRFNKVKLGAGPNRLSIGRTGRIGNVTLTRLRALQTNWGVDRDGHDEII